MERITSRENDGVKCLSALLTKKKERDRSGLFACEGARLCGDALASGLAPQASYLTERAMERYPEVSALLLQAGRCSLLDERLAERISDTKNPQGVFAVFKRLDKEAQTAKIVEDGNYLLLAGLQDPGNLGTILRTAEALGITGIYLDEACPDLYAPKVLRASMGGVFRLSVSRVPDMPTAVGLLREKGIRVYAAALTENALPLRSGLLCGGAAVLIGNEGAGLPGDLIDCCDASLIIEMPGGAESLGAAAAAAIFLWEMRNQTSAG